MPLANRNKDMHAKYHLANAVCTSQEQPPKVHDDIMSSCALAATHQLIGGGRSILTCLHGQALWSLCSVRSRAIASYTTA